MSEILTSIAQPMRYMIELDTPLVLKKNSGMLMEGDVEANTVVLEVFKTRNVPADLSGITFCLYFTRPDGNTLQPIAGTVKENTVQLTLTGGCYKYTGQYTMLVTMKKGEENRTVLKATGHMEGRNTENMIDPEGTFPTPEELLEMLNMLDEALQSANTATENATAAATRANNAAAGIETVTATATELEPNEEATAQVIKGESGMHFAFGIPRGEKGEKGEKGDPGTAENVTIDSVAGLREALNNKQPKGDYLPADGTAADANKLGGKLPEAYATKESLEQYATKEDLQNIDVGQLKEEVNQLKDETGVQNYTYSGRDLSVIFGTLSALHAAVSAGDFSKIRVGDYWPITLSGSIKDYASGETKTLSNAVFKLEVAPQVYLNYGDTPVPNHLLMCSRDLLPWTLMYRSEDTTWYDGSQTNPWLGSHLYQTLNATDGILPLVEEIFGSYMYAGPNGNGMRFLLETKAKDAANATVWGWGDRGKLFLPTEREVWGQDFWSEHSLGGGAAVQWPMFIGSLKHIIKGLGNGGSRHSWWCQSSCAGNNSYFTLVNTYGYPNDAAAANTWLSAPLCFLFV